jgi:hypothetical protein
MKKTPALLAGILVFLQMFATTTTFASASAANILKSDAPTGAKTGTYLSPVKSTPIRFTGLGVKWHELEPAGTTAELDVRFMDGDSWTGWYKIENESNGDDQNAAGQNKVTDGDLSSFIAANETDTFQYKVFLSSDKPGITPVIENPEFTYINARENTQKISESAAPDTSLSASISPAANVRMLGVTATESTLNLLVKRAEVSTKVKIISRSEWGADESLRIWQSDRPVEQLVSLASDYYDKFKDELKIVRKVTLSADGKQLTWPLQYPEKVRKIIIHHTASTNDLDNPVKAIRDIYYWHAISKGWGDIGYNYVIDQQGNIYEGRYGGDGVVGAHAGGANIGSIGIAVLGNYQTDAIPQKALDSLESLIKIKAEKYGIDPTGSSVFRGENLPNIMGHRDVMATSCPGEKLYALLPAIRSQIKGTFKSQVIDKRRTAEAKVQYDYSLINSPSADLKPGETKKVAITIKNTGETTWGPNTYMIVSNDENSKTLLSSSQMIRTANYAKQIPKGSTATFNIDFPASYKGGMGTIEVFPFIDGKTKLEKYVSVPTSVETPNFDYAVGKISVLKTYLKMGETTTATVEIKNAGNITWKRDGTNKILLGTDKPHDRVSQIMTRPGTRLGTLQEREVKPGATGHFLVNIKAPSKEGSMREYFAPVIEGVSWLASKDSYFEIYVYSSLLLAKFTGATGDMNLAPGTSGKITVNYLNAGGAVWKNTGTEPLHFDVIAKGDLSVKNAAVTQTEVLPGQTANLIISVTAPKTEGFYEIKITPKLGANALTRTADYVYVKVGKQQPADNKPAAQTSSLKQVVTVDLSFKGTPVISADGVFKAIDAGKELGKFTKNEKVSINYDNGKYRIKGDKQEFTISNPPRFESVAGSILRVDNYEHHPDWNTTYNDNEYRGALQINWYDNALHVVNEVGIEDYLKGLAEISATDPVEKIKAVIVLARSYAYFYANMAEKFQGAPFNLTDDPQRSQKYLGYGFEKRNPTGVKAVNDTVDKVVTYKGKLIKTPYFSSDDGRTRSAQEVWGWTDTPYLSSVDDPGCKGQTMQGHGVGLSGCGSFYLANLGRNYTEIIKYFFQGVEIKKQNELQRG